MDRQPTFTLRVTTDQPRCTLVFEPIGSEYELRTEDEVLVHVYGRATRPEDADVEVMHESETILSWLPDEYRAWNKAGTELRV
jgi:hypothetical protein